jgi:hypothetical protein
MCGFVIGNGHYELQINLYQALVSGDLHDLFVDASQRELKLRLVRHPLKGMLSLHCLQPWRGGL